MNPPLLSVREVTKTYPVAGSRLGKAPRLQALHQVSFDLASGTSLAVVGESGSGKSTLARQLLLLEAPDSGTIHYRGELLERHRDAARMQGRARLIFQNPWESLNPRRRIRDILAEPLVNAAGSGVRERDAAVHAMLEKVGLPCDYAARYPHMLSGGQRQRVAIARALILRPEIVIADEAVAALDVSVQAQVLNLMLDLREEFGMTWLFISHDIGVVEVIADEILVLYLGRMVEHGAAATVLADPAHPYTRALLASTPRMRASGMFGSPPSATGEMPSALYPPSGCVYHPRCDRARPECRSTTPMLSEAAGRRFACHHPLTGSPTLEESTC